VIFALIAGRLIVPNSKDPSAPQLDPQGAVLSIVGLVSLVYGIIEAPSHGWTDPLILTAFGIAAVMLTSFITWERRSDHPMLNLEFFKNPRFTAANISVTLVFFALFGSLFFLTQYLQFVLGYTALQAGYRVAPIALVLIVVSPVTGRLVNRLGNKVLVALGMSVVAAGLWYLSTLTISSGYGHVLISIMVLGTGMALAMTPATESIMGSLPLAKAGVGSAMNDTTRQIGGALGVAILGSVFASAYTATLGPWLTGLPASAATAAQSSVGAAIAVGNQVGGAAGIALVTAAKSSFIHAMDRGLAVGTAVTLVGAIVSLIWLPKRAVDVEAMELHIERPEGVPVLVAEEVDV